MNAAIAGSSSPFQISHRGPRAGTAHAIRQSATRRETCELEGNDASRRDLFLGVVSLVSISPLLSTSTAFAEGTIALTSAVRDPILAYEFNYPTDTGKGRKLPIVFSRRPERYSSAAPLTADARQRIVCELASLADAITISVAVGPPSPLLTDTEQSKWTPKLIAEAVLIDKSTARISTGQRVSLNSVEKVEQVEKDGQTYYVYESIARGSPTLQSASKETYRHAYASTTIRNGSDGTPYLYTMSLQCPQELWEEGEAVFKEAVESFRLVEPTKKYVAPDRDPWRFF